ncbi:MAG: hypothetical protein IT385_07665 [Deltaproteobacteria bacterium]|nr:hypothetical protein [Deltaproteobacteria bacterium]
MTLPQQRLPGTTYFISAVCERRECRLPPTEETAGAIAVALYDAAERYRVKVVAVSVPNNHMHLVVYDELGLVSEFMRDVNSVVARFGNARDGVKGWGFWDRQQVVCVALGDARSVVDKVAYTMANPVTSFLVERLEEWPGLNTRLEDLGRWRGTVHRRPARFFREGGRVSEVVEVASELPPMVEAAYGVEGFARRVGARMEELMASARAEAAAKGHGFLGVERVLARGVWFRPKSSTKRKAGREAEAIRRVAAGERRLARMMAEALLMFRRAHRAAWEAFRRGLEVVFPAGTYKAWRWYGAERAAGRGGDVGGGLPAPSG